MKPKVATWLVLFAALFGLAFASVSTSDFVNHLDRQVHSLHCSFIPGLGAADATGKSGCHLTLMSPYSSMFRKSIWGGLPISLPAMGVFGFIAFWCAYLLVARRENDKHATGFLVVATGVPVLASMIMGYIALVELDAACKLCIGIYASSALAFGGAWKLWQDAKKPFSGHNERGNSEDAQPGVLLTPLHGIVFGLIAVLVPVILYFIATPSYAQYVGTCGTLTKRDDTYNVMVNIAGPAVGGVEAVEILDPLCPACKAFEQRLTASGLGDRIRRKALLFPLDNQCNWMIGSAVHPGACAVSEAVLCAGDRANVVLQWAFDNQDAIRVAASRDPKAAESIVRSRFPDLGACIGSAAAKARLNRSLRWAVSNNLPVLTPQFYVQGVKLCDEDTDLGLDYALSHMLENIGTGIGGARRSP